jgi:hypothetical protein
MDNVLRNGGKRNVELRKCSEQKEKSWKDPLHDERKAFADYLNLKGLRRLAFLSYGRGRPPMFMKLVNVDPGNNMNRKVFAVARAAADEHVVVPLSREEVERLLYAGSNGYVGVLVELRSLSEASVPVSPLESVYSDNIVSRMHENEVVGGGLAPFFTRKREDKELLVPGFRPDAEAFYLFVSTKNEEWKTALKVALDA